MVCYCAANFTEIKCALVLCVNGNVSPVLNIHWLPTEYWQDNHSVRQIKNKHRQGDTQKDITHTRTHAHRDTHCLGQQGGLAATTVLVRASKLQQKVAPSAAPSVHRTLHA